MKQSRNIYQISVETPQQLNLHPLSGSPSWKRRFHHMARILDNTYTYHVGGTSYVEADTSADAGPYTFFNSGGSFGALHFDPSCQPDHAVVAISDDPVSDDVSTDDSGVEVEEPKEM